MVNDCQILDHELELGDGLSDIIFKTEHEEEKKREQSVNRSGV